MKLGLSKLIKIMADLLEVLLLRKLFRKMLISIAINKVGKKRMIKTFRIRKIGSRKKRKSNKKGLSQGNFHLSKIC